MNEYERRKYSQAQIRKRGGRREEICGENEPESRTKHELYMFKEKQDVAGLYRAEQQ
jgi:hypothetical protein